MESISIAEGPGPSRTFVDFGGHFGFARIRVVPTTHNSVEVVWVRCCERGPTEGKFQEELGEEFQQTFGLGHPLLITTLSGAENCEEKRGGAIEALFPPVNVLHARYHKISVVDTKTDGKSATAARKAKLRALLNTAENDSEIARKIRIRLAEEEILHQFYKGAALLKKKAATYLPTICELIQHRKHQKEDLQTILDRAAAVDTIGAKEDVWLLRLLAANTRVVRRGEDRHYSETGDSDKEFTLRRGERVLSGLNKLANELLDKKGPEALAVYPAFKASRCYFKEACRAIPQIDGDDDPAFWGRICRRLELFDFSSVADNVLVVFPLAVVSWALRKEFARVCTRLGLHNLARLEIPVSEALDALEADWMRESETLEWATKTKDEKDHERARLESEAARAIAIPLRALRKDQIEGNREPECQHRRSSLSLAEDINLEPTDGSGDDFSQGLPSVRESPDQSSGLVLHPLTDATLNQQPMIAPRKSKSNAPAHSAEGTEASIEDNIVHDVFPMTQPPNLVCTANTTAPGNLPCDTFEVGSGTPAVQDTARNRAYLDQASVACYTNVSTPGDFTGGGFEHANLGSGALVLQDAAGNSDYFPRPPGDALPPPKRLRIFPPQTSWPGVRDITPGPLLTSNRTDDEDNSRNYTCNSGEALTREMELPLPFPDADNEPQRLSSGSIYDPIRESLASPGANVSSNGGVPHTPQDGLFNGIDIDAMLQEAVELDIEGFAFDQYVMP